MRLYVAPRCPHSQSMQQLLRMCGVEVETIDVSTGRVPQDVLGTPAIVLDGRVYHGDSAFELLDTLQQEGEDPPAAAQTAPKEPQSGGATPGLVDPAAVAGLFDVEPVVPRK